MTPFQRERAVSVGASVLLHSTFALALWLAFTEWDQAPEKEPVQFVELVSMPKLLEPEPENPAALSTAHHQSEQVKEQSAASPVGEQQPAVKAGARSSKLPEPTAQPKSVPKPPASKVVAKAVPEKKAPLKRDVQEELEEVHEDNRSMQVPLSLTPSLEAVSRWDRNRRMQAQSQAHGSADEVVDINTKSAQFGDYFSRVKQRITWSWIYPQQAKNEGLSGNVDVIFTISREGKVIDVRITRSSGVPVLDQEAVAAVRKAAPFGPLPDDWQPAKMIIRSTFEYVLNNAGMKFVR
jgi:protein TonB